MAEIHEGGCLCGAVRYRVAGDPIAAGVCHATFASEEPAAPSVGVYFDKAVEGGTAAMRILSALDCTIDFDGIEAASLSVRAAGHIGDDDVSAQVRVGTRGVFNTARGPRRDVIEARGDVSPRSPLPASGIAL